MPRSLMREPERPELSAFATLCALALFLPPTPLVEHFAGFVGSRGMTALEAQSLLVACAFGCLTGLATVVWLAFAGLRRLSP